MLGRSHFYSFGYNQDQDFLVYPRRLHGCCSQCSLFEEPVSPVAKFKVLRVILIKEIYVLPHIHVMITRYFSDIRIFSLCKRSDVLTEDKNYV